MSSNHEDEVLSLESSSSDFEGFEEADITPVVGAEVEVSTSKKQPKETGNASKGKRLKSVVHVLKNSKPKTTKKAKTTKGKKAKTTEICLENLSQHDITVLRNKLGLNSSEDKENSQSFHDNLRGRPNLHIEVDPNDLSGNDNDVDDVQLPNDNFLGTSSYNRKDVEKVLFGNDKDDTDDDVDDEWNLPQNYVTEKGRGIDKSLAKLVNLACTSQSNISEVIQSYKLPENCDLLAPPSVNLDVWKVLGKRGQTSDRLLVDIQNIVAAEMVAVVKLASVLKQHITGNAEAKGILSDLITLMGQVQYNLSLRRRYMCRPYLDKKYSGLCNVNVPLTSKLFGDDIAKEVKNCEAGFSLARDKYKFHSASSGYGPQRPFRGRHSNFRSRRPSRFQPYGQQGRPQYYNQSQYGQYGPPRRGSRAKTAATVSSAPN